MPVKVAKRTPAVFGSRAIVNAGALVFAASMVLSVGGFVFHALASRHLGVDAYGAFYALISLYTVVGLPVSIFAPVVAKYSAEFSALHDDGHVRGLIGWIIRAFVFVGALYVVAGLLFATPLSAFLHVAPWEIPIVGLMAAVGILASTMRSIGQGLHAYGAYAWSLASEGVVKVAALLAGAALGLTIFGTTGAFLCGMTAGAVVIAAPLIKRYRRIAPEPIILDWRRIFATTGGAAVLTLTMTAMGFADVLIVKHFFPPEQAGLYSVASLCGKILLYFVGFVPAILIPQATHRHARGEQTRKILWGTVVFIAVVSLLAVAAYRVGGLLLLHILTGRAFDAALPLLPTYAAAMAALALTNSLGSYGMATHRLAFVVPLLSATLGTLGMIAFAHPTLQVVVSELMIGNLVMALAVVVPLAIQGARGTHA
jgi:O-antigen/teichoic acid export membrane protein